MCFVIFVVFWVVVWYGFVLFVVVVVDEILVFCDEIFVFVEIIFQSWVEVIYFCVKNGDGGVFVCIFFLLKFIYLGYDVWVIWSDCFIFVVFFYIECFSVVVGLMYVSFGKVVLMDRLCFFD